MKQSEVKELSVEELNEKLGDFQKSYADLKLAHSLSPLENPIQLRGLRRSIARIRTEINNRTQLES